MIRRAQKLFSKLQEISSNLFDEIPVGESLVSFFLLKGENY